MTALERSGVIASSVHDAAGLARVGAIIVPGVAHFGQLAGEIDRRGLRAPLLDFVRRRRPYLGICAGFQLLFDGSAEAPGARGLGILTGEVAQLAGPRVTHMGWSRCEIVRPNDLIVEGWAYFCHSFAPPAGVAGCIAVARCGPPFAAACAVDEVFGVQFHPEKSGAYGASVLRRWLERIDAC